jgi:hypothetical protein
MKCPRTGCKNEAMVDQVYGVLPCKQCQAKDAEFKHSSGPEFVCLSKSDRIQHERDVGAKDILQPFVSNKPNPEFVKAYPELIDNYFSREEIKNI